MSNVKDVIINNAKICNENRNNIHEIYKELDILKICIQSLEDKISKISQDSTSYAPSPFIPNKPTQYEEILVPPPSDECENLQIDIKKI